MVLPPTASARRARLAGPCLLAAALALATPAGAATLAEAMARAGIGQVRMGQLRLSGRTGDIRLERLELRREPGGGLRLGALRSAARLLPLGPLELRGRLDEPGRLLRWRGDARLPGGPALAAVTASYDRRDGSSRIEIDAPAVELGGQGVQLGPLLPALSEGIEAASGRIGLRARLVHGHRPEESVELLLDDVSLTLPGARIERLNGVVRLAGLSPLRTAGPQELAAALVDVGVPLTAGLVRFGLAYDGGLTIERLGFDVAGGRIEAGPIELRPPYRSGSVGLTATGLDLAVLVAALTVPELDATGRLDGKLPVEIAADGGVVVTGGRLAARGPGVVRWRPAEPPAGLAGAGASGDIVLQALRDFRYDSLELTLDGRTNDEMRARLSIKGRNPDLYDGYPVELNLNLDGQLAAIVRRGVQSWQVPAAIARRMQGFAAQQ